jgi:hypothetical protein
MKQTEKSILVFLITIIGLAMMASMTSCRGSKVVYEYKSDWNKMPKKSTTTGWVYQSK